MPESPQWWLETRAMYAPAFAGRGGSSLLSYGLGGPPDEPPQFLPDLIDSFAELPKLIREAQGFGTDLLYLNDYWEGGYLIKGDYIPRADLGGVDGMREGVRAAHDMGARVIVYRESFLVHADSRLGLRRNFPPLPFAPTAEFRSDRGCATFDRVKDAVVERFDGVDLTTLRTPSEELATLIDLAKKGELVDHDPSWERA